MAVDMAEEDHQDDALDEFRPERELAAAVFKQAFLDIGVGRDDAAAGRPDDARSAKRFLFDAEWLPMRAHWLGLLGMTDEEFQVTLAKTTHQGHRNRVLEALKRPGMTRSHHRAAA